MSLYHVAASHTSIRMSMKNTRPIGIENNANYSSFDTHALFDDKSIDLICTHGFFFLLKIHVQFIYSSGECQQSAWPKPKPKNTNNNKSFAKANKRSPR